MSDRIANFSPQSLQTHDFTADESALVKDSDQANDILEKRGGALTFDSQGNLKVIVPPERRDNAFVRFFKGLFSAQQREIYKQLDRMDALAKNISFNKKIVRELIPYLRNPLDGGNHVRDLAVSYVGKMLTNSAAEVAQAKEGGFMGHFFAGISSLKDSIRPIQEFHTSGAYKSYCINNGGKLQAADEFARDILSKVSAGGAGTPETVEEGIPKISLIATSIASKCMQDPDSMIKLLPEQDADMILKLHDALMSPANSEEQQAEELPNLISSVTEAFMRQLGEAANQGLTAGQDPFSTASAIKLALIQAADQNTTAGELTELLMGDNGLLAAMMTGTASASDQTFDINAVDEERSTALNNVINSIRGSLNDQITNDQGLQILTYCERNDLSVDKFIKYIGFLQELNNIYTSLGELSDYKDFFDIALQIEAMRDQVQRSFGRDMSPDDLLKLASASGFYLGVVGQQYSSDAIQKLTAFTQQMNSFSNVSASIAPSAEFIANLITEDQDKALVFGSMRTMVDMTEAFVNSMQSVTTGSRVASGVVPNSQMTALNLICCAQIWAQNTLVLAVSRECAKYLQRAGIKSEEARNAVIQALREDIDSLISDMDAAVNQAVASGDETNAENVMQALINFAVSENAALLDTNNLFPAALQNQIKEKASALSAAIARETNNLFSRIVDSSQSS